MGNPNSKDAEDPKFCPECGTELKIYWEQLHAGSLMDHQMAECHSNKKHFYVSLRVRDHVGRFDIYTGERIVE